MKLKNVQASKALTKEIARRVRVDFESGEGKYFPRGFNEQLQLQARFQANVVATVADLVIKEEYSEMIEDVADVLSSGIPVNVGLMQGWEKLGYRYRKTKFRYGTQDVFWKRTGQLSQYFRRFSNAAKAKAGLLKSKPASYSAVKLVSEGFKNRRRYYRYTYHVTLPEIASSSFRDMLFRQQFLNWEKVLPLGSTWEDATTFKRLAYNELGTDQVPARPWIQLLVQSRGKYAQERMASRVKQYLKS